MRFIVVLIVICLPAFSHAEAPKPAMTYAMLYGTKNAQNIQSDMELRKRKCDDKCKNQMKLIEKFQTSQKDEK